MPASLPSEGMLGPYILVREAGRGGMSVVHKARHKDTGRTVALKVLAMPPGLPPKQAQDMRARFEREARAVARLSHPNIIAIHELSEQDGQLFLVMEYLRGETLRERLGRGPLTPAQALPVLRQLADAVDTIHAQGVVHRDIKPSNVILLPDGTAKLLDFGIARHSDDATVTSTGALVGSPAYMAPEQVRGGAGTTTSDVWALGALLYEMLAGHPPFTGDSIPSVLYRVSHENPAPVAGLTTPVQRVLRRALDKNPSRRYQTARALAESLAAALSPRRALPPARPAAALAVGMAALLGLGIAALHRHPKSPTVVAPTPPALAAPVPHGKLPQKAGSPMPRPPAPMRPPGHGHTALLVERLKVLRQPHPTVAKPRPTVAKPRPTVAKPRPTVAKPRPTLMAHAGTKPRHAPHPQNAWTEPVGPASHQSERVQSERVWSARQRAARRRAARRRSAPLYFYPVRPQPPRRGEDDFDTQALERLEKYIYPVGH